MNEADGDEGKDRICYGTFEDWDVLLDRHCSSPRRYKKEV